MKRLVIVLLLVAAAGVSISLTPVARGRADESALTLSGADVALFNTAHECTFCHGLHGAGGSTPQLDQPAVVEVLCMSCHGPGGPATTKAEVHTNDPTGNSCCGPFRVTCQECHDPHSNQINRLGNENLKLVLADIVAPISSTSRQVVFESLGGSDPSLYSFCDDDEDNNGIWDQVCDVCHDGAEMNRHHFDGTLNHHKNGDTCTRSGCHTHANALSP